MRAIDLLELGGRRRTPLIRQAESSECGLASLAMVAAFHGVVLDMVAMRRRFGLSLKGATLATLIQIAEQLGFMVRPLRGEIADLSQLELPAVLHWDLDHFVVLVRIGSRGRRARFHIHDPAVGAVVMDAAQFSKHFTGVVLELTRSETFVRQRDEAKLRISQLWSRMTGLWQSMRSVLALSLVLQMIALATPFYLQLTIDTVLPSFDQALLTALALGFGGLALIGILTGWLRSLMLVSVGNAMSFQIVANLYRHLLSLPLPYFEKRHVGDIISRFGSTQPISNLLSQGLVAGVIDGVMALFTLVLMFVYSPLLAGIALLALGLFATLRLGFIAMLRARNIDAIIAGARENSAFIESLRGVATIKAFGQEGNRHRHWQQLKANAVNAQIRLGRLSSGFDAGGQFIVAVERIVFVFLAVRMAMDGSFTVGMIFAFQSYKQQFLDASTRLIEQAIEFRLLDMHLGRIADIALSVPEGHGTGVPTGVLKSAPIASAIELRQVGFRYGTGDPNVLTAVDMSVAAGTMAVLIGPSGGGKTTLLKIMMGLFEPTQGRLLIDGRPLGPDLHDWRRRCGSVMQEDALFAGSLAENIAFFDPEIDMERVHEACRQAFIHDDIMAMPLRYDTLVGDMGSTLSGGQKQRVLLGRALYGNPSVLFMDEGTAHLDPQVEQSIASILAGLKITRVMIAHRPQALQGADALFVVANGAVRPFQPLDPATTGPGE